MTRDVLHINMFGTLSLSYADKKIDYVSNRSKLLWNILSYLICHRGELIRTEDLIASIWDSPKNSNPAGAMRTAIFRARQMLSELTENSECKFLISQNCGYMWNPEIPIVLDTAEFEKLLSPSDNDSNELERCLSAFELYNGKFLSFQSSDLWVMPLQAYYHNLYDTLLDKMIPLLEKAGMFTEGIRVCRKALKIEPFSEKNHQYLMRFLLMTDEREEVIKVYEDMSKLLLSTFGILPDQESRALYREALFSVKNDRTVSPEFAIDQLKEQEEINCAFICDYDFFKILYQAHARSVVRSGTAIHIGIISLKNRIEADSSKSNLSATMDILEKHMSLSLRKGDIITRCSASQFIIMLLSADYENSIKVCNRFVSSFEKKYPSCPFYVDTFVQALQPSTHS